LICGSLVYFAFNILPRTTTITTRCVNGGRSQRKDTVSHKEEKGMYRECVCTLFKNGQAHGKSLQLPPHPLCPGRLRLEPVYLSDVLRSLHPFLGMITAIGRNIPIKRQEPIKEQESQLVYL
jgi:hypothetical protein